MILPRPIDAPRFFPGDPDGHNTCGEDPGIRLEALGQLEQSGESELRFERLFAKRQGTYALASSNIDRIKEGASELDSCLGSDLKSDEIVGATLLWRQATTLPVLSSPLKALN
jgi:hypothetical protein